jgi:hypothetical protein
MTMPSTKSVVQTCKPHSVYQNCPKKKELTSSSSGKMSVIGICDISMISYVAEHPCN